MTTTDVMAIVALVGLTIAISHPDETIRVGIILSCGSAVLEIGSSANLARRTLQGRKGSDIGDVDVAESAW